ncbi:MAG: hypothetical protein GXP08_03685 [Gammaproteobacteria bacterium]|nr:hypothetical protein [Gammaproteobacteria bacterium]
MIAILAISGRLLVTLSILMMLLSPRQVAALDLDIRTSPLNNLDVAMIIRHDNLILKNSDISIETNLNRIGILVYDVPETNVHLGLSLGYAFVSHSQQVLSQGQAMDGFFLGVSLRTVVLTSGSTHFLFLTDYLFQEVSNEAKAQHLSVTWSELNAQFLLRYDFHSTLNLRAGVGYGWLNATQKVSGAVFQTLHLASDRNSGFLIGVDYKLSPYEFVGLQYHNGYLEGVQLQFQRWF